MIYDIHKSYAENLSQGPLFGDKVPERKPPPESEWADFLGFRVASRLGVPAGPLLDSRWVGLAARLGYDIVTYKTIRSRAHPGHGLPNIVYVNAGDGEDMCEDDTSISQAEGPPADVSRLSITNSFGMPSQSPEYLRSDIPRGNATLSPGQVMVVSIVGTPDAGRRLAADFVDTALFAKDAGAKVIEANFSCPNVETKEGSVYVNPDTVHEIASALTKALGETPLIVKTGVFPDRDLMRRVLVASARAGVRAVSGINTIRKYVVRGDGTSALGPERPASGVCGAAIRKTALGFVRDARDLIEAEALDLRLIGVGGVTGPEHADLFLETGADFVQSATGMMWNPALASQYHERKGT